MSFFFPFLFFNEVGLTCIANFTTEHECCHFNLAITKKKQTRLAPPHLPPRKMSMYEEMSLVSTWHLLSMHTYRFLLQNGAAQSPKINGGESTVWTGFCVKLSSQDGCQIWRQLTTPLSFCSIKEFNVGLTPPLHAFESVCHGRQREEEEEKG